MSDIFAALANPTRRELLRLLLERGEQPVGRQRFYALRPEPLREVADWLGPYERFWRTRLADRARCWTGCPMSERTSIAVDQFLAHPPSKVWRALTDSDLLARWLMPNDFRRCGALRGAGA